MRVFFAFVKKEILHILRDRRTLLILFGMPIAQVLIFGYAVTNEFKDAQIDILDHARNQTSLELMQHLESSGEFHVNPPLASDADMEAGFKSGRSKLVLVIPANFDADLFGGGTAELQLIADGSDPNNANTLVQYATQMIMDFQQERLQASASPYQISVETRLLFNPQLISAYNFIPGTIALILLIISAMMTSLTIAKEKELGTMEILLVSPLSPWMIILGKVTPYAALSFLDAVLVLLMGYVIFDVPIMGSLLLLLTLCFLYVVTALSLGALISSLASSQQTAMMASLMGLMMPSMILSGFIFPRTSMPVVLQMLSNIVPATHFIEILKAVMLRGAGIPVIWMSVVVLVGMTLGFLVLAWKSFSIRLD